MKKIRLGVLASALLLSASVFAQEAAVEKTKKSPTERSDKKSDKMTELLNLSEDQAAKLKATNAEFAEKYAAHKAELKALKLKGKEMRTAHEAEIKSLLNEEQLAKYEELKKAKMEKRAEKKEMKSSHGHDGHNHDGHNH